MSVKTVREIIRINEELCTGCGDCVPACEEGALAIIDGKARLVKEIYCDGLGACLGECPTGALTIEKRESVPFDLDATEAYLKAKAAPQEDAPGPAPSGGCPGAALRSVQQAAPPTGGCPGSALRELDRQSAPAQATADDQPPASSLGHWPVQLKLVPPEAPFLQGADLLVCADCVAFACPDFHSRYLPGRAVLIGCPKLDDLDSYREKLPQVLQAAGLRSLTVLRMEVPCCGGIAQAAIDARNQVAPALPLAVHTIGIRGEIRRQDVPAGASA